MYVARSQPDFAVFAAYVRNPRQRLQIFVGKRNTIFETELNQVFSTQGCHEFLWGSQRNYPPVIYDCHSIAQVFRLFHVMRGKQYGSASISERRNRAPELSPRLRVETRCRFIQKKKVGLADQSTRNRQALPLASGKLAHPGIALLGQSNCVEYRIHGTTRSVKAPEKTQSLTHRQLLRELGLLELSSHTLPEFPLVFVPTQPEHSHCPSVGLDQSLNHLNRRGLAGTIGTQHPKALANANAEVETVDRSHRAVVLLQCFAFDGKFGHPRNQRHMV